MTTSTIKSILEAAIFAAEDPLTLEKLLELFPESQRPEKSVLISSLEELAEDYHERGVELACVASGYRFQARSQYADWLKRLWQQRTPRCSRALLETLALIAYKQPLTRGEIEQVRGVAVSSNIIKTLQDREWVKVVGHRDVPGKPALLATTKTFLDYFNLTALTDLPSLSELMDLDELAQQFGLAMPEPVAAESSVSEEEVELEECDQAVQDVVEPDSPAQLADVVQAVEVEEKIASVPELANVIPIKQPIEICDEQDSLEMEQDLVAEEVV